MFSKKINSVKMLTALADYRLVSAEQLSVHFGLKKYSVWKHLRKLEETHMAKVFRKETGRSKGRPEAMWCLTKAGIEVLRENEILSTDLDNKYILAENLVFFEHQILQNWFRLHLVHANLQNTVLFEGIPTNSSLYWKDNVYSNLYYEFKPFKTCDGKEISFFPDVVMRCYDKHTGRSLLFFIEIDRGTESLISPDRKLGNDIAGKIINYLHYWDKGLYKQYEQVWKCSFNGFRLLFVANSVQRCNGICRLVSELGNASNFVWLTHIKELFISGIGGHIWHSGGLLTDNCHSILGEMAFEIPIPDIKYHA